MRKVKTGKTRTKRSMKQQRIQNKPKLLIYDKVTLQSKEKRIVISLTGVDTTE